MDFTDRDLLERFAGAGDESAFRTLVERYAGLVYQSAIRRLGNPHAAEDVAQAVFTLLARKASGLSAHGTLAGWLHTATRWEANRYVRTQRRRREREERVIMDPNVHHGAEPEAADWNAIRPLIDAAIDTLSDADREAVLLRFFAGKSYETIGDTLGMAENAARMRTERALQKLGRVLSRRGITSTALAAALVAEGVCAPAPAALVARFGTNALCAAATATTTVALFTMTTTKAVCGSAALLVAGSLGVAWYEAREANETRVALMAATQQSRVADRRIGELSLALAKVQADFNAAQKQSAASAKILAAPASAAAATGEPRRQPRSSWADPAWAKLAVAKFRAMTASQYRPLYAKLHLTSDQIQQFEAIQDEYHQGVADILSAGASQGIDGESSAGTSVARMTSDPNARMLEKLRDVLGESGLEAYKQYDSPAARTAQKLVAGTASDLYAASAPMTAEQGDQLRQLIVQHTTVEKIPMPSDGGPTLHTLHPVIDTDTVLTEAGAFLLPDQVTALRNQLQLTKIDADMRKTPFGTFIIDGP